MKSRVIKSASIAFMLTFATLSVNAQRPGGGMQQREKLSPEKMTEIETDRLDQVLELTDKQESKIYDIILNSINSRPERPERAERAERAEKPERGERAEKPERGERAERGADREQNSEAVAQQREQMQQQREQMQKQKLETTKAIMAVLNDDQKIEYAIHLSKEHGPRQPREDRRGGQGGQGGPQGGQGCPQGGQGCPQGGQDAPRAPRN